MVNSIVPLADLVNDLEAGSLTVVDRDTNASTPMVDVSPVHPPCKSRRETVVTPFRSLNVGSVLWYLVTFPGRAVEAFVKHYDACL